MPREWLLDIDMKQRRVYVLNKRLHHGLAGIILGAVGIALAVHDRKDWRQWL